MQMHRCACNAATWAARAAAEGPRHAAGLRAGVRAAQVAAAKGLAGALSDGRYNHRRSSLPSVPQNPKHSTNAFAGRTYPRTKRGCVSGSVGKDDARFYSDVAVPNRRNAAISTRAMDRVRSKMNAMDSRLRGVSMHATLSNGPRPHLIFSTTLATQFERRLEIDNMRSKLTSKVREN